MFNTFGILQALHHIQQLLSLQQSVQGSLFPINYVRNLIKLLFIHYNVLVLSMNENLCILGCSKLPVILLHFCFSPPTLSRLRKSPTLSLEWEGRAFDSGSYYDF